MVNTPVNRLCFAITVGWAALKRRVARAMPLPPDTLSLNPAVMQEIAAAQEAGREVWLASASNEIVVAPLARPWGRRVVWPRTATPIWPVDGRRPRWSSSSARVDLPGSGRPLRRAVTAGFCVLSYIILTSLFSTFLFLALAIVKLICLLLLYWLGRMTLLANRGAVDGDPVVFAMTDSTSWLTGIGMLAAFAVAL